MSAVMAAALLAQLVAIGGGGKPITDADFDRGIVCKTRRHCTVDRALFERVLADESLLASAARVVPSIRDGQPDGFRLYAIRSGSFWARLGFANGDTIQSIDGIDITSPETALAIYAKLRNATELSVRIVRRGRPLTLTYEIR